MNRIIRTTSYLLCPVCCCCCPFSCGAKYWELYRFIPSPLRLLNILSSVYDLQRQLEEGIRKQKKSLHHNRRVSLSHVSLEMQLLHSSVRVYMFPDIAPRRLCRGYNGNRISLLYSQRKVNICFYKP